MGKGRCGGKRPVWQRRGHSAAAGGRGGGRGRAGGGGRRREAGAAGGGAPILSVTRQGRRGAPRGKTWTAGALSAMCAEGDAEFPQNCHIKISSIANRNLSSKLY